MRYLTPLLMLVLAMLPKSAHGALPDPWEGYDEAVFMDMDLASNLETPRLQKQDKLAVRTYMRRLADKVAAEGYHVELDRDDEVMVVVVPLEQLFAPNDTLLSPRAPQRLSPLLKLMSPSAMFKVLYAVHSDNTGSEAYNYDLSNERVKSLYDWLLDQVSEDQIIIPFAMGDTDPAAPNDTRAGRAANRRLELYYIPGPEMITRARSGKLK